MKALPSPTRPESCLSDFMLDRRLAGELDVHDEAAARTHLDGCARCAQRYEEVVRERDAFMAEPLPSQLRAHASAGAAPVSRPGPSASRRRLFAATGVLATAAALVLFVLRFHASQPLEDTRTKGSSAKLGFYVKHGEHVRLGTSGEHVLPGDAVRFVYATPVAAYLAVLSVDGARRASVYYPSSPTSAPVAAGDGVALPVSTVLDDTLGAETIYGVFCPEPFAIEPLRAAVEAAPDRRPAPPGCDVEKVTLQKDFTPEEVAPSP